MRRYWQFLLVGIACLLVALLWAQPIRRPAPAEATAYSSSRARQDGAVPAKTAKNDDDENLPGSSSSLPLLAVIGFGVLAGGITSAMRTR
ncbi:MAG: hypothetical protein ACM3PW_13105 [Chlamydiota bacterium]